MDLDDLPEARDRHDAEEHDQAAEERWAWNSLLNIQYGSWNMLSTHEDQGPPRDIQEGTRARTAAERRTRQSK